MSTPAIRVENLGKRYRLGATHAQTLGHMLLSAAGQLFGRQNGHLATPTLPHSTSNQVDNQSNFWALKDVSFEVQPGEVVGVIGRNGAGKSTLLKILSNITSPTTGRVAIHGRVASLLEVGTGFHPELTGRENVFLNGAILGMGKVEVRRKFDEIVAFAEIDQFIDTPVKRYSSGMYVRLAFAVAAHLEPEILIVDEVLAVGDVAFQRKCLGKIGDVASHGRTVLFVSHNMHAVRTLCTSAVWLHDSQLRVKGESQAIVESYLKQSSNCDSAVFLSDRIVGLAPDPIFRLRHVELNQLGETARTVLSGYPVEIVLGFSVFQETAGFHITIELLDSEGTLLFESLNNGDSDELPVTQEGDYVCRVTIPRDFLSPRTYILSVKAGIANVRSILPEPIVFSFDVYASGRVNRAYPGYITSGKLAPLLMWETNFLGPTKVLSALTNCETIKS